MIDKTIDEGIFYKHFQRSSDLYEFYINAAIMEHDPYSKLISTLKAADEDDDIMIHLSSPGGSIEVGIPIINAIQYSKANVTTVLSGSVASLGSLIFLAGDNHRVEQHSLMMFHNYSSWSGGKGHELVADAMATKEWIDDLNDNICFPFLTPAEIKKMKSGKDYYFNSEQVVKRLKRVYKTRHHK